MQWNGDVLDSNIAPGISKFKSAEIPELPLEFEQAKFWSLNYVLNSILRGQFNDGFRQIAHAILRRAGQIHRLYSEARNATLCYLEGNDSLNPKVSAYYDVLSKWEIIAIDIGIVLDLYKAFQGGKDKGAFSRGDGSKEYRIYTIANQIKHIPSCVKSGQCTSEHTVPLWLSEHYVHSFEVKVSYIEICEIVCDICSFANEIQDPLGLAEKLKLQNSGVDA